MKKIIIKNAHVVTPHEVLFGGCLIIEDQKIVSVERDFSPDNNSVIEAEVIDAQGNYLLPGIIDIHTDAIDVEINPRSTADFPIATAFKELEKRMCGVGITTAFHSLHLGYKDAEANSRSKYSREEIFHAVHELSNKQSMINNKIHLRYEISGNADYALCFELIEKGIVSLFSFMDHTPGQGQFPIEKFYAMAAKKGFTAEQAKAELVQRMSKPKITQEQIDVLARHLINLEIPVAYHDVDNPKKVDETHRLGISICEFPINMETAACATAKNQYVVGGAANILRGGSTGGNLNVKEAIGKGYLNTLCSDYYPPSIIHSIFQIVTEGLVSLHEAVNMATLHPAKASCIDQTKGSIEVGKDADLLFVEEKQGIPAIRKVFIKGHTVGQYALQPHESYEFSNA